MPSLSIANLSFPGSPVLRCRVCGFAELRTDEVADRHLVLAECPRCDHRWTGPALPAVPRLSRVPATGASVGEAATAA